MENVTDPIDLTICRLLIIPLTSDHEIWFATRSGLIARLHLDYSSNHLLAFYLSMNHVNRVE